jgi:ABC-type dipeptide/oligopeptide/nickel transport system ATPase component
METINGSRWWKFDFHTHTPFSTDTIWHGLTGDEVLRPENWLRKYMEAGIDCVAVTDHNGGGWIDTLKSEYHKLQNEQPDWFRELYLFPGVEISVNSGIHILGLFGPSATTETIHDLLAKCDFSGTKGDPEIRTDKSPIEVAREIRASGGLCIPAHIDTVKGLFETDEDGELQGDSVTKRQLMEEGVIDAVEIVDPNWSPPGLWTDIDPQLAQVVGTDCHNFQSGVLPGDRFTWVKMGEPCFDGLRLALNDGSGLSVMRGETEADPNQLPSMVIESVAVKDLKTMGRGNSAMLAKFSPWLTGLIGGRGSGKSTLIDGVRLAFERGQDLPDEMRPDFEEFNRTAPSKRERGMMLEGSSIQAIVKKPTGKFRLTWTYESQQVGIELWNEGQWVPDTGDVRQRFPIRVLSQKEVFEIARDPLALTQLIDQSPDLKLNDWREQLRQLEATFKRLRNERRELETQVEPKKRLLGELSDVKAGIELFERGDNRQTLQDYQRRQRQSQILNGQREELEEVAHEITKISRAIAPSDFDRGLFDEDVQSDKAALEYVKELQDKQVEVAGRLSAIAGEISEFLVTTDQSLATSEWTRLKEVVEEKYVTVVEALTAAGVDDPSKYGKLVQKRAVVEKELTSISDAETRLADLAQQCEETAVKIHEHRMDRAVRRAEFLNGVLEDNRFVRATVIPYGDSAKDCEVAFRNSIECADRFDRDIYDEEQETGILASLYDALPGGDTERSTEFTDRLLQLKKDLEKMALTGQATADRTQPFANRLNRMSPDQLDNTWLWAPDDVLRVEYCHDQKRNLWRPIEQGSPGQKTAAILAFLLSNGETPILLDQPEDDLDNHLIYDLIVQQIREKKRTRQIIVATHNPNIVVNGDAEMVIAMNARSGQCQIDPECTGSLQSPKVREEVCDVMEGGQLAFEKRYRRIMLSKLKGAN